MLCREPSQEGKVPKSTPASRVAPTAKATTLPSMATSAAGDGAGQQVDRPRGQQQAEGSAGGRQHEAFGEQMAEQARRFGAQRGPDGEFARTGRVTHQQQVGDVHTDDAQEQPDRREKDDERRAHAARQVSRESCHGGIACLVRSGILPVQFLCDVAQVGAGHLHGDARA